MAKDARQSDDQPVNDAPFGADIKNAAPTHAAQEKSRRGPKAKPAIEPSDIQGLKYFDKLKPLLARFAMDALQRQRDEDEAAIRQGLDDMHTGRGMSLDESRARTSEALARMSQ